VHAPKAPKPSEAEIRAAERRHQEMEQRISAQRELDSILDSKAWKKLVSLKETGLYRVVANARFGDGWDRIDPNEDPRVRLARVKNSRTYKFIVKSKTTNLYRWYVKKPTSASSNGHHPR